VAASFVLIGSSYRVTSELLQRNQSRSKSRNVTAAAVAAITAAVYLIYEITILRVNFFPIHYFVLTQTQKFPVKKEEIRTRGAKGLPRFLKKHTTKSNIFVVVETFTYLPLQLNQIRSNFTKYRSFIKHTAATSAVANTHTCMHAVKDICKAACP